MRSTDDLHTDGGREFTELVLEVFKTNGRLLRAGDDITREFDITSARWQVFGAIDQQPRTVSQIARHYELSRQGVLWTVNAMCKQGLLELIDNPDHRRAKLVDFSEHGREVYASLTKKQAEWSNHLAKNFTNEELALTCSVVRRLGEAVYGKEIRP